MKTLKNSYNHRKEKIKQKLKEFYKKSDKEIFSELAFCLLTPQSKAKICWDAAQKLTENNKLFSGNTNDMLHYLKGVRFANNKAEYIIEARKIFTEDGKIKIKDKLIGKPEELRKWLVENIKGLGYKEASHFLRNIGFFNLAILDRHILKNLLKYGVIKEIPKSLTRKKYLEIEKRMKKFSKKVNIPVVELDLLFWSEETGEIFK